MVIACYWEYLPHAWCCQYLLHLIHIWFSNGLKIPRQKTKISNCQIQAKQWHKWDNVLRNRPSKIYWSQSLKNLTWYSLFKQPYHIRFLKDVFRKILLGPFFNILSQIIYIHYISFSKLKKVNTFFTFIHVTLVQTPQTFQTNINWWKWRFLREIWTWK